LIHVPLAEAVVSIVTAIRTGRPGFESRKELRIILLTTAFRAIHGAHPVSCTIEMGGSFPRVWASGAWSWPLISI